MPAVFLERAAPPFSTHTFEYLASHESRLAGSITRTHSEVRFEGPQPLRTYKGLNHKFAIATYSATLCGQEVSTLHSGTWRSRRHTRKSRDTLLPGMTVREAIKAGREDDWSKLMKSDQPKIMGCHAGAMRLGEE